MTDNDTVNSIRKSTREIVQYLGYLDNLFASIGSVSQCHALLKLEQQPLTLLALSDELNLDRSTVSRLAQGLVNKHYCRYVANQSDGRSRYLQLTQLGKQKVEEIHRMATKQVKSALQDLNSQEKKLIQQSLALYAQALKNTVVKGE